MKKLIFILLLCALFLGTKAQKDSWELTGNSGNTTKNFLGTLDCNPLVFKTNDTERMRLLTDKSFLGIGISDPDATLHLHLQVDTRPCTNFNKNVRKLLQFTTPETGSNSNNGFSISSMISKEVLFQQHEEANLDIQGPSGGITIAPDGNVGIGTDEPKQKLHVKDGNILISDLSDNIPNTLKGSMIFGKAITRDILLPPPPPSYIAFWGIEYLYSTNNEHGLNFWKYYAGDPQPQTLKVSALFLSNTGSVGIGKTNPQATLDVNGSFKANNADIAGTLSAKVFNVQTLNISGTLSADTLQAKYAHITGDLKAKNAHITGDTYLDGNVGIGTAIPKQKLHIVDGNIMISKTSAKNISPNGSIFFGADVNDQFPNGKWGIEYLNNEGDYGYGLNFWRPWNPGGGGSFNFGLFLADDGNIGIGTNDPQSKLRIKDGPFSVALGSAPGENLGWGTSYIGFNATRNNNGVWTCAGDNANNGGSVIYATVGGAINFASIPSTGGNSKTLTDAQIKQNVKMQLTADGAIKASSAEISGKLRAKEVKVTLSGWADHVFANDYKLLPLNDVAQYIKENNRLPNIPSAAEVEENGVELGNMQAKLLMKIEELTLYILDLQKQIDELKTK